MASQNVDVNISLTGTQAAVADLQAYIKSMEEAGQIQSRTAKSAVDLAGSLTSAAKAVQASAVSIDKLAVAMRDMQKQFSTLAASQERVKVASDGVSSANERQATTTKAAGAAAGTASVDVDRLAAANIRAQRSAVVQIQALERQTRSLIVQRDALQATMTANNNFVDRMAKNAPKLSKFSLYVAGGFAGAMYEGIKQYSDFNKRITQTFSEANVNVNKQAALTQNMRQIAKDTGRSFDDVANSLYRVASATASWNNSHGASVKQLSALVRETSNLQVIGNLATGAQSDQAARIIGAVANSRMKDFKGIKDPIKNSAAIAAMANAIVGAGDIRMADLVSALGRGVLASARSVGVGMKDTGAFIDLLTSRGTAGAPAGTYVAHAFQLLSGSTNQTRQWQAAIGLKSGEMATTMKEQGLGAAARLLRQHMKQLVGTDYLFTGSGKNKLVGQDAAKYMMEKAGLSPDIINMWANGTFKKPKSQMTKDERNAMDAVMQTEMTAMFGGGRQAMPLIALMQQPKMFDEILGAITKHQGAGSYKKAKEMALDTPAARQGQLLNQLKDTLMMFGKTMTPVWLGILKAGNVVLNVMNKTKVLWGEIAIFLGSLFVATGIRYAAKGVRGLQRTYGALEYYGQKWRGQGEDIAGHKWANMYANKYGLEHGSKYIEQQANLEAYNKSIQSAELEMAAAKRMWDAATLIADSFGLAAGRGGSANQAVIQNLERRAMIGSYPLPSNMRRPSGGGGGFGGGSFDDTPPFGGGPGSGSGGGSGRNPFAPGNGGGSGNPYNPTRGGGGVNTGQWHGPVRPFTPVGIALPKSPISELQWAQANMAYKIGQAQATGIRRTASANKIKAQELFETGGRYPAEATQRKRLIAKLETGVNYHDFGTFLQANYGSAAQKSIVNDFRSQANADFQRGITSRGNTKSQLFPGERRAEIDRATHSQRFFDEYVGHMLNKEKQALAQLESVYAQFLTGSAKITGSMEEHIAGMTGRAMAEGNKITYAAAAQLRELNAINIAHNREVATISARAAGTLAIEAMNSMKAVAIDGAQRLIAERDAVAAQIAAMSTPVSISGVRTRTPITLRPNTYAESTRGQQAAMYWANVDRTRAAESATTKDSTGFISRFIGKAGGGGSPGGGIKNLLTGIGGTALGFLGGPWGMIAMMLAPMILPLLGKLFSGSGYNSGASTTQHFAPSTLKDTSTTGAQGRTLTKAEKTALAANNIPLYNKLKKQEDYRYKLNQLRQTDPNAAAALERRHELNQVRRAQTVMGSGGHQVFIDEFGNEQKTLKLGKNVLNADQFSQWQRARQMGLTSRMMLHPEQLKGADLALYQKVASNVNMKDIQAVAQFKNTLRGGVLGAMVTHKDGKQTIDYQNKFFGGKFGSGAKGAAFRTSWNAENWINHAFTNPNDPKNKTRFQSLVMGSANTQNSAVKEWNAAIKAKQGGDDKAASLHASAAQKLHTASETMNKAADRMTAKGGMKLNGESIEQFAKRVGETIKDSNVQNNQQLATDVTNAIVMGFAMRHRKT